MTLLPIAFAARAMLRPGRVDAKRRFAVELGLVYRCVGRSVDDQIGVKGVNGLEGGLLITDIQLELRECLELGAGRARALQLTPNLALGSREKSLHS